MCSILIVDDEQRVRDGLSRYLSGLGPPFRVAGAARDGEEALRLTGRLAPDVVITDINMPHMDGLTFIEQLREANEDAQIIILSGYDDFSYAQKAMRLGACEYLLKPVDREYLKELLDKLWRRIRNTRAAPPPLPALAPPDSEDLVDRALALILARWNDPALVLDEIAEQLFVNTNYLRQIFKKKTGVSFVKYIREYRLRNAQKMLRATVLQVQQIAEQVGYEDARYFSNCFRDWCGQTPSEYKETHGPEQPA